MKRAIVTNAVLLVVGICAYLALCSVWAMVESSNEAQRIERRAVQ